MKSPSVMVPERIDPADHDHDHADHADDDGRERRDRRHARNRLRDVPEQAMHAFREDQLLTLLGGVGLDDPDAAERLVQPAGHVRVDLTALPEERAQAVETSAITRREQARRASQA
jgi:hypothetical protein